MRSHAITLPLCRSGWWSVVVRISAQLWRRCWSWCWRFCLSLPLLLALLLCPRAGWAQAEVRHWGLRDPSGQAWGLVLFRSSEGADLSAWRLRLTLSSPGLSLSHRSPLLLDDGLGRHWQLRNRSDELVPLRDAALPAQSAQFDLSGLQPRPSEALPLHLRVPLEDGVVDLLLGADPVAVLSGVPVGTPFRTASIDAPFL